MVEIVSCILFIVYIVCRVSCVSCFSEFVHFVLWIGVHSMMCIALYLNYFVSRGHDLHSALGNPNECSPEDRKEELGILSLAHVRSTHSSNRRFDSANRSESVGVPCLLEETAFQLNKIFPQKKNDSRNLCFGLGVCLLFRSACFQILKSQKFLTQKLPFRKWEPQT